MELESLNPRIEPEKLPYFTFPMVAAQNLRSVGGKAFNLAILSREDFPVPAAIVLMKKPENEAEWDKIFSWWQNQNNCPLAVRSSAKDEDSSDLSFAGQQTTFLNVSTKESLRNAIENCFASIHREASRAYRDFFKTKSPSFEMNVVLQVMINAKFAGVYFSKDPRGKAPSWIVESIEGLGEDLVSGRKNPARFNETTIVDKQLPGFNNEHLKKVVEMGSRIRDVLEFEVDTEWAFDQSDRFWLLQARPVTALHSHSNQQKEIAKELSRLRKKHPHNVIWDGQTFSEWTGFPSYLTFSIWKDAFAPEGAFSKALKRIGYLGFTKHSFSPKDTLLERVFGRAYVNLSLLEPLFFGPTPYTIAPMPRPHLVFNWRKINLTSILRTPQAMYRMALVAWRLQSERRGYLNRCSSELAQFRNDFARPVDPDFFKNWDSERLVKHFKEEAHKFSTQHLEWPFVLIILAEATLQTLQALLKRIYGAKGAEQTLQKWLGMGLQTLTVKMNSEYRESSAHPEQRSFFMNRYGHRGPGELDLSNPRWVELGDRAFGKTAANFHVKYEDVEVEINKLGRFQKPVILQEWRFLKKMLELREQWKMEIMRPYAHMRWMALEIGNRLGIGEDVFWLRLSEVLKCKDFATYQNKVNDRKQRFNSFRKISFPVVVGLDELEEILSGKDTTNRGALEGEGLSPGMAFGEVRVVVDPEKERVSDWPENVVLVAEATDPGWTPLFQHAKAVVVEKGGVLSHCAIVAREMGIPAVSQIQKCHLRLKNGDHVWVDGSNGRIVLA